MLDPDGLNVWSDHRLVGYLWRNNQGLMGFRYEDEWLVQGGFAISHTLPLQHEDFSPEESLAHRFFANLLLAQTGARLELTPAAPAAAALHGADRQRHPTGPPRGARLLDRRAMAPGAAPFSA